jgi:hypothetical protein
MVMRETDSKLIGCQGAASPFDLVGALPVR